MALQIEDGHHKFSARIGEKTVAVLPCREDGDQVILKATRVATDYWATDVAAKLFDVVLTGLRARGNKDSHNSVPAGSGSRRPSTGLRVHGPS
jgi:hypothetical protein